MRILDARGNPFAPVARDVRDYERLARAALRVNALLVKALPLEALEDVGMALGFHRDDDGFLLPHEDAMDVLLDCCLHDWIDREGRNLVRDLADIAAENGLPEEDRTVLDAMLRPRMSLFRIEEHWPGAGARLWDAIGDGQITLLDSGLGRGPDPAGAWLVARIIEPRSWSMTTGAPVVLGNYRGYDQGEMLRTLRAARRRCRSEHEMAMTLSALALKTITERSGPRDALTLPLYEPERASPSLRAPRAPGRNDPCPCGSGRKYKKCCALMPRPAGGDRARMAAGR
jgi:hypothetical protein